MPSLAAARSRLGIRRLTDSLGANTGDIEMNNQNKKNDQCDLVAAFRKVPSGTKYIFYAILAVVAITITLSIIAECTAHAAPRGFTDSTCNVVAKKKSLTRKAPRKPIVAVVITDPASSFLPAKREFAPEAGNDVGLAIRGPSVKGHVVMRLRGFVDTPDK